MSAQPRTIELVLPALHKHQQIAHDKAARFNVLAWGRRSGKSVFGRDRVIRTALDGKPAAWFAPSYKLLADAWRELRAVLAPLDPRANDSEHRIELITGGVIEAWSLDGPDPARGRKYARIVIDEAALVPHLKEAWNGAIRPTLTDYRGDAWFLSTPKGHGYFWHLYQSGLDAQQIEWRSWSIPTAGNPYIAAAEIENARLSTPDRWFRQEFMAEFIEDGGSVFRHIDEAATAVEQASAIPGHQYVIGVDWGKDQDFTVFVVIDLTLNAMAAMDRSNHVEWTIQRGRLMALYERFKPSTIIAERNSMGDPIIEQLSRDGLPIQPFLTTNATKATMVDALALAFERSQITILRDPVLIGECKAFEPTTLPSGLIRYSAPEGEHDDCVIALALAWQGIQGDMSPAWIEFARKAIEQAGMKVPT